MIIYLHGFCSSPASAKAQQLGEYLSTLGRAKDFCCPRLPPDPVEAIGEIESTLAEAASPVTLVGSSLGGFYASCLAEARNLRAALINPALPAHLESVPLVGEHRNFHSGEEFSFTAENQQALLDMAPRRLSPKRYLLLVETGDEVLDAAITTAAFSGAQQIVLAGGDHSFTRFAEFLPTIVDYADAAGNARQPQL